MIGKNTEFLSEHCGILGLVSSGNSYLVAGMSDGKLSVYPTEQVQAKIRHDLS